MDVLSTATPASRVAGGGSPSREGVLRGEAGADSDPRGRRRDAPRGNISRWPGSWRTSQPASPSSSAVVSRLRKVSLVPW